MTTRRRSKYVDSVKHALVHFGHATNAQLCDDLRVSYPHLSDTTVHRITQRLYDDGEIGFATLDRSGVMVYDARADAHDHFYCDECDMIRDIDLPGRCRASITEAVGPCQLSDSLKIVGTCQSCIRE